MRDALQSVFHFLSCLGIRLHIIPDQFFNVCTFTLYLGKMIYEITIILLVQDNRNARYVVLCI